MSTKQKNLSVTAERFAEASAKGKAQLMEQPTAMAARYSAGRVHVELNNGCAFVFPVHLAEGLVDAKPHELKDIEVTAAGLGLHWPQLDADLYVPALVKGLLGTQQWMAQIGRAGGQARSTAKATASRNNGRLGGRPKSKGLRLA